MANRVAVLANGEQGCDEPHIGCRNACTPAVPLPPHVPPLLPLPPTQCALSMMFTRFAPNSTSHHFAVGQMAASTTWESKELCASTQMAALPSLTSARCLLPAGVHRQPAFPPPFCCEELHASHSAAAPVASGTIACDQLSMDRRYPTSRRVAKLVGPTSSASEKRVLPASGGGV